MILIDGIWYPMDTKESVFEVIQKYLGDEVAYAIDRHICVHSDADYEDLANEYDNLDCILSDTQDELSWNEDRVMELEDDLEKTKEKLKDTEDELNRLKEDFEYEFEKTISNIRRCPVKNTQKVKSILQDFSDGSSDIYSTMDRLFEEFSNNITSERRYD